MIQEKGNSAALQQRQRNSCL
ncbi:hypothetical protein V3C99_006975 [Haemonchus contortus]